jgi:hypothetical protein
MAGEGGDVFFMVKGWFGIGRGLSLGLNARPGRRESLRCSEYSDPTWSGNGESAATRLSQWLRHSQAVRVRDANTRETPREAGRDATAGDGSLPSGEYEEGDVSHARGGVTTKTGLCERARTACTVEPSSTWPEGERALVPMQITSAPKRSAASQIASAGLSWARTS